MHDVNLWAALVSGLVYFAIGGLWYSPMLFAKPWMAAMGISPDDEGMKKGAAKAMTGQFIVSMVTALILTIVVTQAGAQNAMWGAISGFWLWLGFSLTAGLTSVFFERKSLKLLAINQGFTLVSFVAMGVIAASWK